MYFSYVPSIIFSFFNRPFFLNLLFKQILIHYYILLLLLVFICVLSAAAPGAAVARVRREDVALRVVRDVGGNLLGPIHNSCKSYILGNFGEIFAEFSKFTNTLKKLAIFWQDSSN